MLKLENISKYYYSGKNVVMALRKINLEFKTGEFVAITGESGSGKSTLLNVLSGLDTYEDGKMSVNGQDISHYTVNELETYRKQYIAFVFQDYNIIDSYTVLQNVEIALTIQGYDPKNRKQRAIELIDLVGLDSKMNQKASKLSGGEKQRTVIARALAKDCPVIVCDEPTGNLDTESSKNILKLLHEISSDKLVIVVTHNYAEIHEFATRKIRLYDGEIVEDQFIEKNRRMNDEFSSVKFIKTRPLDILKISWNNIISVPKKSFFTLLIISFMIVAFIFAFGYTLKERNTSLRTETYYFENANPSRVIVTKRDNTPFTDAELEKLGEIEYVRSVVEHDTVFDSVYTNVIYNQEYDMDEFFDYKVLAASSLNEFDLISGRLPNNEYEVVIGNNGFYVVDDFISISNREFIKTIQGALTDQYTFKIVGIVEQTIDIENVKHELYFHDDALDTLHNNAIYENSQKFLVIDDFAYYGLTQDVRIDNTLGDMEVLAYDMMFFDMCRDFGYKAEIIDDFDAGLCPSAPFIEAHTFSIDVYTRFGNTYDPVSIELDSVPIYPHIFGQGLYVNINTFNTIFEDAIYQPSVVVYDMFEANKVKAELEEMGYNVFYPSGVINEDDAMQIIIRNLQLSLTLGLSLVVVYFVGYFVIRNVVVSKRKDYLIYRSIGASKRIINQVVIFETLYLSFVAFIIVMSLLSINERFDTPIPRLLRYFSVGSYISLLFIILILMILMARNFNKTIFGKSVISSLKAE
ncbi:MAG: ATP-binding cassette domain-containing protein [Bacilli bacterium]|nr:ATP-binding cassette domain-containing protein [Bacilli bacterium]